MSVKICHFHRGTLIWGTSENYTFYLPRVILPHCWCILLLSMKQIQAFHTPMLTGAWHAIRIANSPSQSPHAILKSSFCVLKSFRMFPSASSWQKSFFVWILQISTRSSEIVKSCVTCECKQIENSWRPEGCYMLRCLAWVTLSRIATATALNRQQVFPK